MPRTSSQAGEPEFASLSDEALLLRYREEADERAFAELVRRYERELYSYLRRYLGSAEMAEDAFQATFLQVHLKCDRFEEGRRFRPWLYTIATNQAIDAQRRNRRHKLMSLDRRHSHGSDGEDAGALADLLRADVADPTGDMEAAERTTWIRDAVAGLSADLRAVVALIYYQGMKYREAADVLKIPVGTVKSRMHSAVLKLHEAWTRRHPGEEIPSDA
ncbi:MAG: sigma-70 family RNA polymerase sigma factor [Pirellulales bacterium]|nr:sigma-70 family RNA polymerase sigma factor [Pirellulales bacterium]